MKSTLAIATIGAVSALEATHQKQFEFMQFVADHSKSYKTVEEYAMRFERYLSADAYIIANNADKTSTHVAGHNHLSDSTQAEFDKMLGALAQPESDPEVEVHSYNGEKLGNSKDWTGKCSTPIKNQGSCGSCWAFAGTEAVETAECIQSGNLYVLSVQQQVDCNTVSHGCDGGWADSSFTYLQTNKAMLNADYRYTQRDGTCKYNASKGKFTDRGAVRVSGNNSAMMQAINGQPVTVAINASGHGYQTYKSGVLSGICSTSTNHANVAVGYNSTNGGNPYWRLRNSWGAGWGDKGFINMAMDNTSMGMCGVNSQVYYPRF